MALTRTVDRTRRKTRSSVAAAVAAEEEEDDYVLNGGLGDSFDEDINDTPDDADTDEEKPWQKSKVNRMKEEDKKDNSKQVLLVPKKKKRKIGDDDEAEKQTTKESKISIKRRVNNESNTNKNASIKVIDKNNKKSSSTSTKVTPTSLIANMAPPSGAAKDTKFNLTNWKPKDEYHKTQSRHKSSAQSSQSSSSQQQQKGGNKESKTTDANIVTATTNGNTFQDKTKAEKELNDKVGKELAKIIDKVLGSKVKTKSSSAIDDLLRSNEINLIGSSSKQEGTTKSSSEDNSGDLIGSNGSFIPRTDDIIYDFFEFDKKGNIVEEKLIPMFPEDFKRGDKQWPLEWWGIIPASDEILAMHEKERPTSHSDRRNGRDRSKDRGRSGDKDRGRSRDSRERSRGRSSDKRGGYEYDQHYPNYPHRGPGLGGPEPPHGYGGFHHDNHPPGSFNDRFPARHGPGGGGWPGPGPRIQEDGWFDRDGYGPGRGPGPRPGPGNGLPPHGRGGGRPMQDEGWFERDHPPPYHAAGPNHRRR